MSDDTQFDRIFSKLDKISDEINEVKDNQREHTTELSRLTDTVEVHEKRSTTLEKVTAPIIAQFEMDAVRAKIEAEQAAESNAWWDKTVASVKRPATIIGSVVAILAGSVAIFTYFDKLIELFK